LQGARVLDAFAGTGALGLEAISRGAESACFIENGKVALTILRSNIKLMRAEAETEILRRDATQPGQNIGAPFAVVFMDPPYAKGLGEVAIKALGPAGWIAPDALIVWEEAAPPCLPQGFDLLDQRKYGDTVVTIARTPGPAQA
jgi:16S rRNA (guanine966-N2)-methyltransferase